ncbi:MAG: hypothetical protein IK093_19230 [Ruminiclostridium sp.]|nr:hypothetical protein [Ruminiclostridium sp.]
MKNKEPENKIGTEEEFIEEEELAEGEITDDEAEAAAGGMVRFGNTSRNVLGRGRVKFGKTTGRIVAKGRVDLDSSPDKDDIVKKM